MQKKQLINDFDQNAAKSRAKHECPPELEEIIKEINIVPPNAELPDWFELIYELNGSFPENPLSKYAHPQNFCDYFDGRDYDKLSEEEQREIYNRIVGKIYRDLHIIFPIDFDYFSYHHDKSFLKAYLICLGQYPALENLVHRKILKKFIKEEYPKTMEFPLLLNQIIEKEYGDFTFQRDLVRELIEYIPAYQTSRNIKFETRIAKLAQVVFNPNEKPCFSFTGLSKALNSVSAYDLLRSCEVCRYIFWAKRKKSRTCSPKCLNALQQRKHRKKNKEEINKERRDNYRYKKCVEARRKKGE